MNLFETIGLTADPFSTSPNVDLFYPALEHRQCLEGLELAIRLKRGLSVVKGGIGVGKTTISRKLIQNFQNEIDDFTFHLILDPKFESEIILLKHIIELFGISESAESVQDCRNIIENYLLKVGVEQGKTLVLIVDEGQNLPGEMLDVFRTLLNFETDNFKLLQLIIFGQPEMGRIIKQYPNFEDRIIFNFDLGPISLEDTKGMIKHRLAVTGGNDSNWFTDQSILRIHKNTQGFPRKITQLCHQSLLAMISEDEKNISEDLVDKVIAGKINSSGLLKQTKSDYNEIAVNKLLNVLQKDDPKPVEKSDYTDDDWIGSDDDAINISKQDEVSAEVEVDIKKPELRIKKTIADQKSIEDNIKQPTEIIDKSRTKTSLNSPGSYNDAVKRSFLDNLPFDKVYLGIHIDNQYVYATLIEERNKIKNLLAYNYVISESESSIESTYFQNLFSTIDKIIEEFIHELSSFKDAYAKILNQLEQKNSISIVIDDKNISSHLVLVPKEGIKEKNQIIKYASEKIIKYPLEESIYTFKNNENQTYIVSIAKEETLNHISNFFQTEGYSVRRWLPITQSIYNCFIWNYPENKNSTTLIIYIGVNNGFIIGCEKNKMKVINPLYLGLSSLFDALKDYNLYETKKKIDHLKAFQVPKSILGPFAENTSEGEYDNIFRVIFESWTQEIERGINGLRKDLNFSLQTEILVCGSAGFIKYFDKFIENTTGIESYFFNPLRNLKENITLEGKEISCNPSVFAGAVGSGIAINNSPNLLPKSLRRDEIFRWVNRLSAAVFSLIVIFCISISFQKKITTASILEKIDPLIVQKNSLEYIEEKHDELERNTSSVSNQISTLYKDLDYSTRILDVNRILSFYTPKEISISMVKFQQGWDKKAYKKIGRDLVPIVKKQDEHLRIVRLAGSVDSNPALLDVHFANFLTMLEETNLFQSVDVIDQSNKQKLGNEYLQFDLKCVL